MLLWQVPQQGTLAKVSCSEFDSYYANHELGVGVWVGGVELLLSSDRLLQTSPEIWSALATPAVTPTIERESNSALASNVTN